MDTEQINILLARHFANETTREQELVLEKWIANHREEYVALKILWADTHEVSSPQLFPVDKAWEQTVQQIRPAVAEKGRVGRKQSNYWIAAASVVLVMVSGLLYYFNSSVTVHTLASEIKKVQLKDGSIVTLNGNSGITYPRYFSANREIELTGEAYFEVKRDVAHPFRIKSNRLLVQVLGTTFLIKNSGRVQHVFVNSGKVSVKDEQSGQSAILTTNQAVSVSNGSILKEPANENYLAWKSGKLNFKDVPLKHVFTALEDYYHISIVVEDGYEGSCLLTSQFERQPPDKVFEELSRIFGFTYKFSGTKVTVSGITCEKQ
ncbi:FecR family protein [Chryseobacterium sp. OSA05B]|uniref:FecR family protein n=1 Tax=Chryseobacterium sp. OSA05B TaxID=2862650 RepID=UPI001CBA8597|nr:FecR family protein [Chryseobacterium sp. OSA05B]